MDKETSARVSTIAAGLTNFRPPDFIEIVDSADPDKVAEHCANVRALAGTALVQDRTLGQQPAGFLDRVKAEHANLAAKHDALTLFLDRETPDDISPAHRSLLELQKSSMGIYRRVLEMRIEDLESDNG